MSGSVLLSPALNLLLWVRASVYLKVGETLVMSTGWVRGTIGHAVLNFRVRDGNGCFHCCKATRQSNQDNG